MTTKEISEVVTGIIWKHAPEFPDDTVFLMSTHIARYIEQVVEREQRGAARSDVDTLSNS